MEVVEAVEDLQHDVFGLSLGESLGLLEVGVEIAIGTVLQAEDYVMLGLEGVEQVDEVIVLDAEEDILLVLEHLHLLSGRDGVLPDEL